MAMFIRYSLSVFIACFLLLNAQIVCAQVTWSRVDSLFGQLRSTIHIYRTQDSLNGRPFVAYYLSALINDKRLQFDTDTGQLTPQGYYEKKPALVVVNGSFFDEKTFTNQSVVIRNSRVLAHNIHSLKSITSDYYYYPTRSAIGINKKRKPDVAWLFSNEEKKWPSGFEKNPIVARGKRADPIIADLKTLDFWKPWRMRTAIGGGPALVHNSQVRITNQEEQIFLGDKLELNARTAMGYTKDNRLIILVIEGDHAGIAEGATLMETAKLLQSLSCVEALNLDGGANSCMLINGRETIKPAKTSQRIIASVFTISMRK